MFEKVNPSHPDKVADRIAGAIVDLAYSIYDEPKIAVEVLIGHGDCNIIVEGPNLETKAISAIVKRINPDIKKINIKLVKQDVHLAANQANTVKCGDNGIFKGVPITNEEKKLAWLVRELYKKYPTDGKFVLANNKLIACQSCCKSDQVLKELKSICPELEIVINPLGDWTGGINVDSGATNRKLGSDMAGCVTGGGLHGKDLSKADVSVNIYAYLKAQLIGKPVELFCAIGDETIDGKPYSEIVEIARTYIQQHGGFENFASWGLI